MIIWSVPLIQFGFFSRAFILDSKKIFDFRIFDVKGYWQNVEWNIWFFQSRAALPRSHHVWSFGTGLGFVPEVFIKFYADVQALCPLKIIFKSIKYLVELGFFSIPIYAYQDELNLPRKPVIRGTSCIYYKWNLL